MANSHNKKRNVGIIYELLLRYISDSLISDNKKSAQKALSIIEKRFRKGSEVYKEFRLFNALANSTVSNSAVAAAILTEAKQAARRSKPAQLDREKSSLIREINHCLADDMFYHRRVPRYREYGNIQMALDEWRKIDNSDLSKLISLEANLVENLLLEKEEVLLENQTDPDIDALVVKLMTEKLNKKYLGKMSENQRNLVKSYVFSLSNDNGQKIKRSLLEMKERTLKEVGVYEKKTENSFILSKIKKVREKVISESIDEVTDVTISRFLVLTKLVDEIEESLNE
jgi:hypothetical protein